MLDFLITLLSLSVLGSVLAVILFLLKPLIKNKVSKAFTYYLWLIVLLRLCLPLGITLAVYGRADFCPEPPGPCLGDGGELPAPGGSTASPQARSSKDEPPPLRN